ncbi:MAG: hypothetical protein BGO69_07190 [Bacteroidetes bacterium 46-16]|nr:MAG: hypothetical protein BGO69_07190 [Bacteroidetes bacterium 46-16]
MPSHTIIILLSCVVILSYLFNLISRKTNIPSVLLLIATGVGIQYSTRYYGLDQLDVSKLVNILGAVGLIMIILEAALDLDVHKGKYKLIGNSFFSALFVFIISALTIGFLIMKWLDEPFSKAFLYAVPLSIISSAIVIPSTASLPEFKKEFIIYESSFSDIIGILVFNYMIMQNLFSLNTAFAFAGNVVLAVLISLVSSLLMLYILSKTEVNIKFFLVFAILSVVYASGELIHLPSLLIVLVFGLVLNNSPRVIKGRMLRLIPTDNLEGILDVMKSITAETSFLIRTFFFILFGYTIQLPVLILPSVWEIGTCIVLILLLVRFLYLRIILRANLFPELFLMPRGLVTILLFYSIPAEKSMSSFSEGILFFVVVITSLLMIIGLLFFNKEKYKYYEREDKFI